MTKQIVIGENTCHTMAITLVNPSDRDWTKHRYVLWFGAYGYTRLMAWANSLEDALDECVGWIADNAPGLFRDEQVTEAYNEAIANGMSEEDAQEEAEQGMTYCDPGHYLASWEWGIVCEDPDRATLLVGNSPLYAREVAGRATLRPLAFETLRSIGLTIGRVDAY